MQWISSEIKLRKSHCTGRNPKPYAGAYYIIRTNKGNGNIDENPDIVPWEVVLPRTKATLFPPHFDLINKIHLMELVSIYISERDQDPHPAGPMWMKMAEERAKADQERVRAVQEAVQEVEKRAAKEMQEAQKEVKRIQRQLAEVTQQ